MEAQQQMKIDQNKNSFDDITLLAKSLHFKTCVIVKHFRPRYSIELRCIYYRFSCIDLHKNRHLHTKPPKVHCKGLETQLLVCISQKRRKDFQCLSKFRKYICCKFVCTQSNMAFYHQ